MKKALIIALAIMLLCISIKGQDAGFNNFIKKAGYVKFTDTSHLPLLVKRNYNTIKRFFSKNHFDKNYYVESNSIQADNGFLIFLIRRTDGLKKLRMQE
jgi:hypothetical protein